MTAQYLWVGYSGPSLPFTTISSLFPVWPTLLVHSFIEDCLPLKGEHFIEMQFIDK